MLVWYIYCVKFIDFSFTVVWFLCSISIRKNLASGKAGLVGPSAEGQLDPPASLRNQSRYGASALLLAPGHFPPPKPAGALVKV